MMNKHFLHAVCTALLVLPVLAGCQNPSDSGGEDPALSGAVSVNGSPSVGGTLTADTSLLEGTGDITYQWILDESAVIEGAAGETYEPVNADAGKTVKVRVSRAGYSGTIESDPVGPVAVSQNSFSYTLSNTIKYISFSQGKELPASKSNTAEWDIALEVRGQDGFCYIYTNSGESAEAFGAAGAGGVWFTSKTDFDAVTLADRVTEYTGENEQYADCAAYETDVTRYQTAMFGPIPSRMNIMTYYGYASGDGKTEGTAFGWSNPGPPSYPFYEFNKRAFGAVTGGMPPPWYPTKQVYIIRHADGVSYSKFQVYGLRYQRGYTFVVSFKFQNLESTTSP
jgi:hypothetical protein